MILPYRMHRPGLHEELRVPWDLYLLLGGVEDQRR
jgi:hypothetical protein